MATGKDHLILIGGTLIFQIILVMLIAWGLPLLSQLRFVFRLFCALSRSL